VRWIGGATGAGKTTVATRLRARFGLQQYSTDATLSAHAAAPTEETPLLSRFLAMDMDDRWLRRDARTMLDTFPWFAGERFRWIVSDLEAVPSTPTVVAEGFRLLPRCVAPLLAAPWHGVWLITTPGFRRRVLERRPEPQQFWRRTSDPDGAFERLLERDALFAERTEREARELGLRVVTVDGTVPLDEVTAEVAEWFRLP